MGISEVRFKSLARGPFKTERLLLEARDRQWRAKQLYLITDA